MAPAKRRDPIDIHQQVTDSIIAAIEAGAGEWQMPWHRKGEGLNRPVNIASGKLYRGINVVALWAAAEAKGFGSGTWGSYRQWQEKGAQVRKGEKSAFIVFYKELEFESRDEETGETTAETRLFARASCVFNADQVEGYESATPEARDPVQACEQAEGFIAATNAEIRYGGTRAYYCPSSDHIQMPDKRRFQGSATSTATEAYYGTLLHELTHHSGAPQRCNRTFGTRFGDQAYAMEELVAELGAAFLCADLSITSTPRPDHAAYIDHWLKILKADKKAIFTAASKAAQATDYLHGLQPGP